MLIIFFIKKINNIVFQLFNILFIRFFIISFSSYFNPNKYVDKQQQMQLQLAAAQIYELYARGELNRAEAKNAIAQSYYYTWVGNGAQLEFHKAMSVAEDWIETKTAELKYQRGTYHGEGTFFERLLG